MARKSQILGAAALDKVLGQLPRRIEEQTVLKALREGAKPIVKDAKKRVPVRSGKLKKAITVRKGSRRRTAKGGGQLVIGFKKPESRRAHLTEFGTSRQPAQPFMRPAIDAQGQAAIDAIGKRLGGDIEKAAEALAGLLSGSAGGGNTRRRRR
jgi:HK97 gp10 family phage protein